MIYDYKCNKCKNVIEINQRANEVGDFDCDCGGIFSRYFGNQKMIVHGLETLNSEFFDASTGQWISSSKRDQIGKDRGEIWMSHDEAEKEAAKNMQYNLDKVYKKANKKLKKGLNRVFK